ncbi:Cell division protein FtsX [Pannonibacter phragmitetus]|uniref:Cell division protein FtsX n=1 Tax=Pannonibacter phragmitetus TaxID=121719 RepID=A0A379A1N8_9HYPH|nr:ABC transporter permease [Pannonibacter phragmitetus]SUB03049.1 Cell division protein FtsX [Pannonibacter phragmitetus]
MASKAPPPKKTGTKAPQQQKSRPKLPRPSLKLFLRGKAKAAAGGQDARLRPSAAIVPSQSVAGRALTLVVAIMSFLACLTVGSVSVVWEAANDWSNDLVREVTVQIRPADGVDMLREIDKAVALTQEFPGIGTVRALSDEETRQLLQPWLGAGLDLETLPVPRLIQVTVSNPQELDLPALKQSIEQNVRGASLDDHSIWTSRLAAMAGAVVAGGFGILALVLFSMVLSVIFATRAAMAGNRDVVSVLHFVGASDGFIAREFQRHFLVLGLKGGIAGGLAASFCFILLEVFTRQTSGMAGADQMSALFGSVAVGTPGYFGVVGIVFIVAVLTALTSGLAVKSHLAKID